jgi:hypothetical protein
MNLILAVAGGVVLGVLVLRAMRFRVFWQALAIVVGIWILAIVLYYMPGAPLQPR